MTTAFATGARRRALIAATTLIGLGVIPWASQALAQPPPNSGSGVV